MTKADKVSKARFTASTGVSTAADVRAFKAASLKAMKSATASQAAARKFLQDLHKVGGFKAKT
jgi:hypothetical protein